MPPLQLLPKVVAPVDEKAVDASINETPFSDERSAGESIDLIELNDVLLLELGAALVEDAVAETGPRFLNSDKSLPVSLSSSDEMPADENSFLSLSDAVAEVDELTTLVLLPPRMVFQNLVPIPLWLSLKASRNGY